MVFAIFVIALSFTSVTYSHERNCSSGFVTYIDVYKRQERERERERDGGNGEIIQHENKK